MLRDEGPFLSVHVQLQATGDVRSTERITFIWISPPSSSPYTRSHLHTSSPALSTTPNISTSSTLGIGVGGSIQFLSELLDISEIIMSVKVWHNTFGRGDQLQLPDLFRAVTVTDLKLRPMTPRKMASVLSGSVLSEWLDRYIGSSLICGHV